MSFIFPTLPFRNHIFVLILFLFLGTIVYWNSLTVSFHYDDYLTILKNPEIKGLKNFSKEFSFTKTSRPFLMLTFAVNYELGRLNVLGYHLVNLILHILTSFILYLILVKTTPSGQGSKIILIASSLVFLVHPLTTESVTYISSRSSILSAFFYLLGVFIFIKANSTKKVTHLYTILFLISYLLTMGSKESSITFPALIFVYDYYFLSEGRFKKVKKNLLPFYLPLLLITFLLIIIKFSYAFSLKSPDNTIRDLPSHIFSEVYTSVYYLKQFFIPINLNIDPDFRIISSFFDMQFVLSFVVFMTLLWISKKLYHSSRIISFSILWFFVTLSPHYLIRLQDIMNERWLYLPLAALSFFVAGTGLGIQALNKKYLVKASLLLASLAIIFFSADTIKRNYIYRSELSLWMDTAEKSPYKARPHMNLGVMYDQKEFYDEAEKEYLKAIELKKDYYEAFQNLGTIYVRKKEYDKALEALIKAITLKPDYAQAYNNLGVLYASKGDYKKAETEFLKAISLDKNYSDVYVNLGNLYADKREIEKAISFYQKAILSNPDLLNRKEVERLIIKYKILNSKS